MANTSDIIGQLNSNGDDESTNTNDRIYLEYLKSIDASIQKLVKQADSVSQSAARNNVPRRDEYYAAQAHRNNGSRKRGFNGYTKSTHIGNMFDDFFDSFERELIEAVVGSGFKDHMARSMRGLASMMGVELQDVPRELGKNLGRTVVNVFNQTDFGKNFTSVINDVKNQAMGNATARFKHFVDTHDRSGEAWGRFMSGYNSPGHHSGANYSANSTRQYDHASLFNDIDLSSTSLNWEYVDIIADTVVLTANKTEESLSNDSRWIDGMSDVATDQLIDVIDNIDGPLSSMLANAPQISQTLTTISGTGTQLIGSMTSLSTASASAAAGGVSLAAILGPAAIAIGAVVAGMILLDKIIDALGPAIEGTKQLFDSLSDTANRHQKSREKYIELAQKRLSDDIESMIKEPFNILEDAANKVYEVWDANLRKINATQGYTKADTQSLMASYASRLRAEDLASVISAGDLTDNLAKVIDSGLTGKIAEEFSYQATKLNAAIPTEDFFAYGEVYASIVANQVAAGKSQVEAIAYANDELNKFASNLLYASRQISGGISTGLRDAHSLFESSVQIAHASRDGVASEISGVLTAIAAATGAIAPDLAGAMTDAIVRAATGGNSSEIVALRSLAGINASNTEFLNSLTSDPQGVLSTLFYNLSERQNMSEQNYMEVAEGLSDIFGLSMETFQRVDFAYLAKAITEMSLNNNELSKNVNLLVSGETTLTAEQLRYRQINEYLIKEGLAYVLDNEVARSIQEHMWEEQLAREMMESTYAVELKGSALEFLEGIRQTIENLLSIFSPAMWFKKAVNLSGTIMESYSQSGDIANLLQAGKIGQGNYQDFYNLITRNTDLNLTDSLLSQLGSFSAYETTSTLRNISSFLTDPALLSRADIRPYVKGALASAVDAVTSVLPDSGVSSSYDWRTVSKGVSSVIDYVAPESIEFTPMSSSATYSSSDLSASQLALTRTSSLVEQMVADVGSYRSYGDWEEASRELGIVDIDAALEDTGRSVNMIKDYYQNKAAKEASDDMVTRHADEKDYRDKGRTAWEEQKLFTEVTVPAFWEEERAVWELERVFRDVTLPAFWEEERTFWADQRAVWELEQTFREVTLPAFWDEERAVWESERIFRDETLPGRWTLEDEAWQRDADFYELAGGYLKTLDNNLKSFYDDWVDYFVNFTAYSEKYSYADVEKIQKEEKDGQSSAIYALAQALTQNTVDLRDPTLQTNALLSQILILVNTIVQQTNTESSGAGSIAETLAGLALGLVK